MILGYIEHFWILAITNIITFIMTNCIYFCEHPERHRKIRLFAAVTATSISISAVCNSIFYFYMDKSLALDMFIWYLVITIVIWLNILVWKVCENKDTDYEEGDEDEEEDLNI